MYNGRTLASYSLSCSSWLDATSGAHPRHGWLRFIEVKGRAVGAATVTVTKNEILTALNKPDDWFLALVAVDDVASEPCYVSRPFGNEPYFGAVSVNYDIGELETRNC